MKHAAILFSFLFSVMIADAQRLPSGPEVIARVEEGIDGVQDYIVSLQADIHMEHIRIPRATATMYFKKPDKVHFDSPSIAMMPREGVAFNSSAVLEQYNAQMIGEDTAQGKKVLKLQLAAKLASTRLRQLFIWVNPEHWTISRLETIPFEGRILTTDFVYGLQEEKYWMPVALTIRFGLLKKDEPAKQDADSSASPETPLEQMQPRGLRSGTISIEYSDYKINTGLSDDVFKPAR